MSEALISATALWQEAEAELVKAQAVYKAQEYEQETWRA